MSQLIYITNNRRFIARLIDHFAAAFVVFDELEQYFF